jgi:sulfhydrogenase subunit alpha
MLKWWELELLASNGRSSSVTDTQCTVPGAAPDRPSVPVEARAGAGSAATEAPRGLLYHRYGIDDAGLITTALIVPPTSQNQTQIEDDLRSLVAPRLHLDTEELTHVCEQAIRSYDPCISCATHFLTLTRAEC